MINLFESAWVIARRDFIATVYTRSFILFLLAPLAIAAFSGLVGYAGSGADDERPRVAVIADSATTEAMVAARQRLVGFMSEASMPDLRVIAPAQDVRLQARILLADPEERLSAVFSGTLAEPLLTGPTRADNFASRRTALILSEAQQAEALRGFRPAPLARDVVPEAVGNLSELRELLARLAQVVIFMITVLLATLLLSNLVEEKSNKIIEVLAAAVPLDAIFLGKLIAMLGISLVGIAVWGGVIVAGTFLSVQLLPPGVELPGIAPAVGWPVFVVLLLLYYTTNYMLLGSLFLGVGAQASNIREIQSLSMPVTFLQLMVLLLAMTVIGGDGGTVAWIAHILPFSSPLAMLAMAAQTDSIWPHLLALVWQCVWVAIMIRLAAGLFRKNVLKSGGRESWLPRFRRA
jgi:ABC-2 type transport system permease protein